MTPPSPGTPVADRAILLLSRIHREPEEDRWLAEHLSEVEDFEALWAVADDNRVAPRVYQELARLGLADGLPEPVRARFAAESARIVEQNRRRLEAARPVLQALGDRGIEVVVLKGAAFGATLYDDPGYKRMNDIDLLVRKERVRDVMQVYRDAGLFMVAERVGGDPDRQLRVSHHLPPYVSRDLACMLGTQWDWRAPALGHDFDLDAVWARTRPLELAGVPLRVLAPEDAVHHVCLHLERYKTGVRDLMDLHNLVVAHRAAFDWDRLLAGVRRARSFDDVYYGLALAQAHRPLPEVARALDALAPDVRPFVRALAAERSRSTHVLLRTCSRQFSTIEKAVSELNATEVFSEKLPRFLHAWGSILVPALPDARKIAGLPDEGALGTLRARLVAPARLLQAIAEEIGGLLLLGLVLKSSFDLVRSLLPGSGKRDLAAYAASLGLERRHLEAIQDHVQ